MPRPLMRASELRRKVAVYLSDAELTLTQAKANDAGLTLAAFLRQAVIARRLTVLPTVSATRWAELSKTTANLNQLLRHANSGQVFGLDTTVVQELLEQVKALRMDLIGARE